MDFKKELKEFAKASCLLISAYFVNQIFTHYVGINWGVESAWILLLIFAFLLYLLSK